MKISIIVVTDNEKDSIQKKLSTMIRQTKQADEIILVDNHSTDHTLEAAERFLHKQKISFKMIRCERQSNRDCLILGTKIASGDYYIIGNREMKVDYIEKIINQNKDVVVAGKKDEFFALQLMKERFVNESLLAMAKGIVITETERMVIRYSLHQQLGMVDVTGGTILVTNEIERYNELREAFIGMKELGLDINEYNEQLAFYALAKSKKSSFSSKWKAFNAGNYKKYGNGLKDFLGDLF